PEALRRAIDRVYGGPARASRPARHAARGHTLDAKATSIDLVGEDAVELTNDLLHAAILRQASDIHVEPAKNDVRIRFRVDGELYQHCLLPSSALASLVSRFKVLSGMDIAEK
ncbi:MAG: ATPase, T2SS/T4P/T4SS family, partial [Planctomycetota bacterium]|nr:ATPase, T2SS/T4P/T4SS family [Planctomycetota bacterium]